MRENGLIFCRVAAPRSHRAHWRLVFVCLTFSTLPLSGQSLQLSSASGSPGMEVSIHLALTSPRGHEPPSALQWDITIPIAHVSLLDENPPPGPEAKAAGKSISCRERSKTPIIQTSTCILYGGREPIHPGVVAVLRLKIARDASPGPARIRIDQAIAVPKDATRVEMKPVEAIVKIRRR